MFDRDRTKPGNGRSSNSSGTGKQSKRESPSCPHTQKCGGDMQYLSDRPQINTDKDISMLAEYKKKRDTDKKKANLKTLSRNGAMPNSRDE
jgi:hypothetical protein